MANLRCQLRASIKWSLTLCLVPLLSQIGLAQVSPMMLGELEVIVKNPAASLLISADASGEFGSWRSWYQPTNN
jgi:hypothetical protein